MVDPLGGSYYVEALTDEIEKKVTDYLKEIEGRGGIIETIKSGWFQNQIARSAYQKQKEIEEGKRVIVGVNKFITDEKLNFQIHRVDPKVAEEMKQKVKKLRKERDNSKVRQALSELSTAAEGRENLVPFVINAVKAYATIGEICDVFRKVYGEYRGPVF